MEQKRFKGELSGNQSTDAVHSRVTYGRIATDFASCERTRHFKLSYLDLLADKGVELAEISHSAHFPMHSNASEMWCRITEFILDSERA